MFYVRHRTAAERHYDTPGPWQLVGPFETYEAADAAWQKIVVNWQEGGVVKRCAECGEYQRVCPHG